MNLNNSSANVCVRMLFNTKGAFNSPFAFYNNLYRDIIRNVMIHRFYR